MGDRQITAFRPRNPRLAARRNRPRIRPYPGRHLRHLHGLRHHRARHVQGRRL
jgi:hypothetical protein